MISHRFTALILFALILAGCGEDPESDAPPDQSPDGKTAPHLLTWSDKSENSMQAIVGGVLRVNSAGCFALDGNVLVAPAGSRVTDDGEAVHISGRGRVAGGEKVKAGDGYLTRDAMQPSPEELQCLPKGGPAEFAVLDPRA